MKSKAILMALAMMTTALAGCTGGTDGVPEVDEDALNELIQNNLQDFINNTTVIVNQDFHYHNNTTVVQNSYTYDNDTTNEYDNTTNIDGGEVVNNYEQNDFSNTSYSFGDAGTSFGAVVNGTGGGTSMLFVAHVEFSAMDLFPNYMVQDFRNNSFSYDYTYYDYLTNSDRNDTFSFSCQVYYLIGSLSNGSSFQVSYWEDSNYYYDAWDNEYNNTMADLLEEAAYQYEIRSTCDEDYIAVSPIKYGADSWNYDFLSIDIPAGYAIQYVQLWATHSWYGCDYWLDSSGCIESEYLNEYDSNNFYNYSEGITPTASGVYYGGWENITIDFELTFLTCTGGESTYCQYPPNQNPNGPDQYSSERWGVGHGGYSIWPTSMYEFTLYYQFVPVAPVE